MTDWILIVVIAQFIYALTAIVDKFILTSNKIPKPFIYAVYITILSVVPLALFLLSPLALSIGPYALPVFENVSLPSLELIILSIISASGGLYALYFLYSALKRADASDVVPVVGSISAVGTLILSFIVLSDVLTNHFAMGFILLVAGTAFISHFRFTREVIIFTLLSGLMYAVKVTSLKMMFILTDNFDQTFFWSRIGILIVILALWIIPHSRRNIKVSRKENSRHGGLWVIGNAILAGGAAFLLLKATDLGNVTIVQALGGLQFVFLTVLSILFGRVTHRDLGENNTRRDLIHKTVSVILITAGFFFLFL